MDALGDHALGCPRTGPLAFEAAPEDVASGPAGNAFSHVADGEARPVAPSYELAC